MVLFLSAFCALAFLPGRHCFLRREHLSHVSLCLEMHFAFALEQFKQAYQDPVSVHVHFYAENQGMNLPFHKVEWNYSFYLVAY